MSANKEAALKYAAKGFNVFPVHGIKNGICECGAACDNPGKHPITSCGFKDASSSVVVVRKFWEDHPNANIGLCVGRESKIVVLDIDPRNGGDESFKKLQDIVSFPKTYTVQTSNGGRHFYFKYLENSEFFRFPGAEYPGIDFKKNGYVIAPPSLHKSGERYCVIEDCEFATLPEEFLSLTRLSPTSNLNSSDGYDPEMEDEILLALKYISPETADYEVWLRIGMAIHSWDPERLDMWEEWSKLDPKRYKEDVLASKWNSFNSENNVQRPITIHTLFNEAKKNGWDPKQNQERYDLSKQYFPRCEFPFHIFEPSIQKLFSTMASQMQVDPEPAACMALAIMGAALGNTIRLELQEQHRVAPFIWFVLIAKSGYGKTPIEELLTREIKGREKKMFSQYAKALKAYEDMDKPEKKNSLLPIYETYISSDFTIEGLAALFSKNPRGTLILKDEVMGVIHGLNQYKSKGGNDREKFLELFNAGSWKIDRVKDARFIPNTGASIVGGAQPSAIKKMFSNEGIDDGLLPRFLFFLAKDFPKKHKKDSCIDPQGLDSWNRLVSKAYGIKLSFTVDDGVEPLLIKLSDSALDAYLQRLNKLESVKSLLEPHIQIFIPKIMTYFGKFCAVLHCMSSLSGDKLVNASKVSENTVEDAYKLVRFFMGQLVETFVRYSIPDSGGSDEVRSLRILSKVFSRLQTDRIPLDEIRKECNKELPHEFQLDSKHNQRFSKEFKALGFRIGRGSKGYSYVEWNKRKVDELTKQYAPPSSLASPIIATNTPRQVNEVMGVKEMVEEEY